MTYLTQSIIADDPYMRVRVASCAAQQGCAMIRGIHPDLWAMDWRRVWASAPGWDAAWESAMAQDPPMTDIGSNPGVVTDEMILSQVQGMMPFTMIEDHRSVAR